MNRLNQLFEKKKENVLSIYFSAGYPHLNDTRIILRSLQKAGVDFVEIGIPFSDPLADGPTIQESGQIALDNGMTLKLLFDQLKGVREEIHIPLIMMGYLNPIMQYGIENFCKKCNDIGIDGIILPDLPVQEYLDEYKSIFEKHHLKNIFLITPQTSDERMQLIDSISNSFIYMVSSASTTGAKSVIAQSQEKYFRRIKALGLKNPTIIGFGISNNETFRKACENANGAIIGSAFIKAIESGKDDLENSILSFVKSIKN